MKTQTNPNINAYYRWIFIIVAILHALDMVISPFLGGAESNPLVVLTGTFWSLLITKLITILALAWVMHKLFNIFSNETPLTTKKHKDNYVSPTSHKYYFIDDKTRFIVLFFMIAQIGMLAFAILLNLYALLIQPEMVSNAAAQTQETKMQSYLILQFILFAVPLLTSYYSYAVLRPWLKACINKLSEE